MHCFQGRLRAIGPGRVADPSPSGSGFRAERNLPPKGRRGSSPVCGRLARVAFLLLVAAAAPPPAAAIQWPWEVADPWPRTSEIAVRPLEHPPVEEWLAARDASAPYRFAVFGDQRALADGEWQDLVAAIARARDRRGVAFVVDTGDIVNDGRYTDQFAMLGGILEPLRDTPYLVGLGNHETHNNRSRPARVHSATFLATTDAGLSPDHFYYRKDLGPATFLFLDTNDLVYGSAGARSTCPKDWSPESRSGEQLRWLDRQFQDLAANPSALTIVVLHHPPVQSSRKHLAAARSLWNARWNGRSFPDILADGGVDILLTGHTHTYERFRLERSDGYRMDLVNLSGRPRDSVFWVGASERRAQDIRGREGSFFAEEGWKGVGERWGILQEEAMVEDEADQFALFTVEPDGGLTMEVRYLDDDEPDGVRKSPSVRLR